MNLAISIFSIKGVLFKERAAMIVLPALEGQIGVLYNHIPMITSLKFGLIKLLDQDNKIVAQFYIDGGVAKIDNTAVNVICSDCCQAMNLTIEDVRDKIGFLTQLGNKASKLEFYQKILLDFGNAA